MDRDRLLDKRWLKVTSADSDELLLNIWWKNLVDDEVIVDEIDDNENNEVDERREERLLFRFLFIRFAGTSLCTLLLSCMAELIQAYDGDDEGFSDLSRECKETVIASHSPEATDKIADSVQSVKQWKEKKKKRSRRKTLSQ